MGGVGGRKEGGVGGREGGKSREEGGGGLVNNITYITPIFRKILGRLKPFLVSPMFEHFIRKNLYEFFFPHCAKIRHFTQLD